MQTSSHKKIIIAVSVIGLVLLALGAYIFLTRGNDTSVVDVAGTATPAVGRAVITALGQLSSLKIDHAFLQTDIFMSLQDFSVPVTPEPVGRPDPFAPIGQ